MRTGGPIGGMGYDIRMRPDNPDVMYVTDAVAGVHTSTDGGRTWLPVNEGIRTRSGPSGDAIPVFSLTIDPNNYDVIWIGMLGFKDVYRSGDSGRTWELRAKGIAESKQLTIRGFAIEPGNSNVVYAAGEVAAEKNGRASEMVHGVVYKTADAGMNWSAVWRGDNLARYVLIDPTNVKTLYVSTGIFDREAANADPIANKAGGVGILKSMDGGQTWAQINNGLGDLYVGSLFLHPEDPQVLLAGAGNANYPGRTGIYLTTNGGASWELVQPTSQQISSVEFAAGDPRVAYAAGDGHLFRSSDGGRTWRALVPSNRLGWGPPGVRVGIPIDFQVDPRNAMRLFANAYEGGNFLSEDGGLTWTSASSGYTGAEVWSIAVHPQNPLLVYINGKNGPFKSADGGATWQGINNPMTIPPDSIASGGRVAVDPLDPQHVVLSGGRDGRIYESVDGGIRLQMTADYRREMWGLPTPDSLQKWQGLWAVAFAPSAPKKVYGGLGIAACIVDTREYLCDKSPIASILLSENGGHTWRRQTGTALDGQTVTAIVVHPKDADVAWTATCRGGVFRTADGGKTWTPGSSGLGAKMVMALGLNPRDPSVLYAGTLTNGLFKSTDGGASWRQSSLGMDPSEPVMAVVVNPALPDVVYAGSRSTGVFVSEDAGASWRRITHGLRTRSVLALSIASDGSVLYAGTKGEGVFRLDLAKTDGSR